jgi:8-amino-7-oxononanoate synthase
MESELEALRRGDRLRRLPALSDASRIHVIQEGRPLLSFCSNDYLGLATHPEVQSSAIRAIVASGFGASAARLVAGDLPDHRHLEADLAAFLEVDACLLFPSGYQANLGTITALAGPDDLIVADRSVHASIIDGCRLSKAKLAFFPHFDLDGADHHLRVHGSSRRRRILVTESLFSMEGDIAPLQRLADLARTHDAILYVDEAHSLGCLGPGGRGLCAQAQVIPDVFIGTLGKAFGASGAFVAGAHPLIQTILNKSRPFIFSTAQPPSVAAAARAALKVIASATGDELRQTLSRNIRTLRAGPRQRPYKRPKP